MRLGTPAITSRGMKESDMILIAELVDEALMNHNDPAVLEAVKVKVNSLMKGFPLY